MTFKTKFNKIEQIWHFNLVRQIIPNSRCKLSTFYHKFELTTGYTIHEKHELL